VGPVAGAGCAGVDVGGGADLELVDRFCCLGGMLGVGGCWCGCGDRSSSWME